MNARPPGEGNRRGTLTWSACVEEVCDHSGGTLERGAGTLALDGIGRRLGVADVHLAPHEVFCDALELPRVGLPLVLVLDRHAPARHSGRERPPAGYTWTRDQPRFLV